MKCAGARSAGNPLAACDEAGTGNGITVHPTRARRRKLRIQTRVHLARITAPVLDPTGLAGEGCMNFWGAQRYLANKRLKTKRESADFTVDA